MTDHIELEHDARRLVGEMLLESGLRRRAYATGALMRALAKRAGADELTWYLTGLLADLDTEHTRPTPERHGGMAADILEEHGFDGEIVSAVRRHGEVARGQFANALEEALYVAADTGRLLLAYAASEDETLTNVTPEMILKKLSDAAFAPEANREHILYVEEMGLSFGDLIALALNAVCAAKDDTLA